MTDKHSEPRVPPAGRRPTPADPRIEPAVSGNGRDAHSVTGLIRKLADDLTTLLSKEVSLAKAELREAAQEAKSGAIGLAAGGGLAFAGLLFLLLAVTFALANVVPMWAASAIVGVVVLVIGLMMVSAGKKKMEPGAFVPERTVNAVQEDKDLARRATS